MNNHWHEHRDDAIKFYNKPLVGPPPQIVQTTQQADAIVVKSVDSSVPKAVSTIAYDLHSLSGPLTGTCVDLSADPIVIGRDPKVSNLIIPLSKISRKHCTLKFVNGNVLMEDNGSVNGTFLSDGQRLTSGIPYQLKAGDLFFLADREVLFEIRCVKSH